MQGVDVEDIAFRCVHPQITHDLVPFFRCQCAKERAMCKFDADSRAVGARGQMPTIRGISGVKDRTSDLPGTICFPHNLQRFNPFGFKATFKRCGTCLSQRPRTRMQAMHVSDVREIAMRQRMRDFFFECIVSLNSIHSALSSTSTRVPRPRPCSCPPAAGDPPESVRHARPRLHAPIRSVAFQGHAEIISKGKIA